MCCFPFTAEEEMVLEEELVRLLPYVYRANSMAKELDKDVSFEIVLLPPETKGVANGVTEVRLLLGSGEFDCKLLQVWVKVKDAQTDTTHLWDSSRFMSRYYGMQEVYQNKMEGAQPAGLMLNVGNESAKCVGKWLLFRRKILSMSPPIP